jgi:hypothetical protein
VGDNVNGGHKIVSVITRLTDGIVIHSKLGVTAIDTELFCYARKNSDKQKTTPLVSAVAEMSSKGTVRGAVAN